MFSIMIDFDEIRERVTDYIFVGAGYVANFVEDVVDAAEQAVEAVNSAAE